MFLQSWRSFLLLFYKDWVFGIKVGFFHRALFRCLKVIKSEVLVFVLLPKCLRWSILRWPDWYNSFLQRAKALCLLPPTHSLSLSYLLSTPLKPSLCRHWHLHGSQCIQMLKLFQAQNVYVFTLSNLGCFPTYTLKHALSCDLYQSGFITKAVQWTSWGLEGQSCLLSGKLWDPALS